MSTLVEPSLFIAAFNVTAPLDLISTPLIFLPPEVVHDINVATYIHMASTGILVWDFLNNLRNDLKLLTAHKLGLPTFLYFVIRLTLLDYAIGRAVLLTFPVNNCAALSQALNILLIISVACTTTFFYLRVIAVYRKNHYIIAFFGLTWLSTVAMASTFFKTFHARRIAPLPYYGYCLELIDGNFLTATLTVLLVNDVLIYIAIAYRIYRIFLDYRFEADMKKKVVILLFGASLPVGSKVVLLESQLYCVIIVLSKSVLVGLVSVNMVRYSMLIICHLVLVTILSSRVYRELKDTSVNANPGPQRRTVTEFLDTGNVLASEEFVDRTANSASAQERVSQDRIIAETEEDVSSTGAIMSLRSSLPPSYKTGDFNMQTLRKAGSSSYHNS